MSCVTPELCVFTLQEQARRELDQGELHEVAHWQAYLLLQLKPLTPDFIVDCDDTDTYTKVTPARAQVTHSVMTGKMFGCGAPGNPYQNAPTANLLPSVTMELSLQKLDAWNIPTTVTHVRGRCEPTRMCGCCGQDREDPSFDYCSKCVDKSLERSPKTQLAVPIKQWEPCSICGDLVPPIEAGVLVDADCRKVCLHDRHGHLHCLRQILETEKRCPSCKTAFVSVVAAPDAECEVGDVVGQQSVQTGWDDEMEREAESVSMKIRAGEVALSQKLAAIQAEEKKKVKAVEAEKTAELRRRIAALAQVTSVDKAVEKQRSSTVATEIKAERKKLEKLAKEVAIHADKRRVAEEGLELKVGALEKKTAETIAGWRAAHNAAMEKMRVVSDGLEKQTLDLMAKERQHAELTAVYDTRVKTGAEDVAGAQRAVDGLFAPQLADIAAVTEQLRKDEQEANVAVAAKL